ncbi:MAG TPA: hypothetical protein VKT78_16300, partial [Fimbriimonadaceae bacterium]|nr:hypothetical protein [Fimbriimonadaceae bacterium]
MRHTFVSRHLVRTALAAVAGVLAAGAYAGPINYATHSVGIRAGIAITDANQVNGFSANSAPFVWYNVDKNKVVKPAGWNFYNPHPPSTVTLAMANRWTPGTGISPAGATPPFAVGSPLNKATAPYWEVPLALTTDVSINDYDVLLLPVYNTGFGGATNLLSLNSAERARLQRFMDHGGVLWIDVQDGVTTDDANGAPLSFSIPNATNKLASVVNATSQIFTYPYTLNSLPESTYNSSLGAVDLFGDGFGALQPLLGSVQLEFGQCVTCAWDGAGGNPTVVTSRVGNGALVITARRVASFINQVQVNGVGIYDPNQGFSALDGIPDANANQAARFAINAVTLLNGSWQDAQGSRKSGSSPIDIGAPLLSEWKDETNGGSAPTATPITYKGLVIVAGQNRLYAYNAVPGADLDFDGNPDDGIPDFGLGKNRDLVWQSVPLNGPLSAPAAIEIPGGTPGDVIAVVDHNGNLQTFNAFPIVGGSFPTNIDNPIVKTYAPPIAGTLTLAGNQPSFGPTVHDGLIYVTDNVQPILGGSATRIWVVDPLKQDYVGGAAHPWLIGGGNTNALPGSSAAVTIGYIPIADNSGGTDRIVYLPTVGSGAGGNQNCGITSLWAGTKGERHAVDVITNPGFITVNTRAQASGRPMYMPGVVGQPYSPTLPDMHAIHLTLLNGNGDSLTPAQTASILTGQYQVTGGALSFNETAGAPGFITAYNVTAVSIDYSLDWDNNNPQNSQIIRGSVQLPDNGSHEKQIIGNLALSPAGTIYAVEANPTDGLDDGMFFALREQGQGGFTVLTRFDLYGNFTLSTPGATAVTNTTVPATFEDNDATQTLPGANAFISGPFKDLVFESGPAVVDGRVFVKVRGYKKAGLGFMVPCMLLLCFNAEPQLPNFTVPVLQPNFTIFQPDPNRSVDPTQPDMFTQFQANQVTYTQGIDHASITMDSLSSSTRSNLASTLSESLPIIIRQPGQPDLTIDPSTVGTWSPLQWYTVFYGLDPGMPSGAAGSPPWQTGPPVVTGNTVFAAANSVIPYVFQGINPVGQNPVGMLVGYNAGLPGSSDAFAVQNKARPYFTQIAQIQTGAGFTANPDLEWPQNSNARSFAEYLQRLYQTVLDGPNLNNHPTCYGIAAGQGGLFAYSDMGVYGFKRANFTVADENRLAAFDPGGNALWTSDTSTIYGVGVASVAGQTNPAIVHPLVRPTRAYPIGATDYLVVDPGSNRLARIDQGGREIRSIDGFVVDPNFQPDGYVTGEPLTFNQPQDVLTFGDYQVNSSPFTGALPLEYWRHYVVADTGNKRIVELVDRYAVDPTSRQPTTPIALGELFYHSPADLNNKKGYDFNSVARILQPGTGTAAVPAQYIYAASIGSTQPSRVGLGLDAPVQDVIPIATSAPFQARDARNGNGGIIVFNGASTEVISQVAIPQIGAGVLWNPVLGVFNPNPIPAHYKTLGGLSSVTMSYVFPDTAGSQSTLTIMFTDSTGVYEIHKAANPIIGGTVPPVEWVVDWMMPTEIYTQLRRDPATNLPNQNLFLNASELKATYARRTAAGTVLMVNNYFGVNQ